jgi:hypothetical protein
MSRFLSACLLILAACEAFAAPPRITGIKPVPRSILKLERDFIAPVDTDNATIKKGAVVDVLLLSGKKYEGLEIAAILTAKEPGTFRGLSFKPSKGNPTKLTPSTLYQLRTAERTFDVVADAASKAFVLLDLTLRSEQAEQRLESKGHRVWPEPSRDDVQSALDQYEELYAKAKAMFPGSRFTRTETQFFIFYTDMPPGQVAGYIASLDAMYQQLCTLFGLPKDTNIWLGKCPIFAFLQKESFLQFEAAAMNNPESPEVAGLCHQDSRGRVITVCARGDNPVFFAVVLVHETAHGFVHRMRSSGRLPPWMDEGLADWIAQVAVPQSDHVSNRLNEAVPQVRASGSLGGDFLEDRGRIERWQYGIAASMTQFLLTTDANAYRAMITGIKEGHTWREALELTYGVTPEELVAAYGRAVGLPGLRP